MPHGPHEWTRVTVTGVVIKEPCILFSVSGELDTSAGSVAIVYNAQSAKASAQVLDLEAGANVHRQVSFGERGIRCENGLYVTMGANGLECLLVFDTFDPANPPQ